MKLPRDVDARRLIKAGTLNAILADVAAHQRIDKTALIDRLFG